MDSLKTCQMTCKFVCSSTKKLLNTRRTPFQDNIWSEVYPESDYSQTSYIKNKIEGRSSRQKSPRSFDNLAIFRYLGVLSR